MAFGGDSERFVCSVSIIESREFRIEANSNNLSYVDEKFVWKNENNMQQVGWKLMVLLSGLNFGRLTLLYWLGVHRSLRFHY